MSYRILKYALPTAPTKTNDFLENINPGAHREQKCYQKKTVFRSECFSLIFCTRKTEKDAVRNQSECIFQVSMKRRLQLSFMSTVITGHNHLLMQNVFHIEQLNPDNDN